MNKLKYCIVLYRIVCIYQFSVSEDEYLKLSPVINLGWHIDPAFIIHEDRILFDIFKGFAREKAIGPSSDICVPFFSVVSIHGNTQEMPF